MKRYMLSILALLFIVSCTTDRPVFTLGRGFDKQTHSILEATDEFNRSERLWFSLENKRSFNAIEYTVTVYKKDKEGYITIRRDSERLHPDNRGFANSYQCSIFSPGTYKLTVKVNDVEESREFTIL